ncbi:hypothetical protein PHPALM_30066 [Phytophthora palmivora]|uniref:RxLR effector protein n=1 Tax=Phytophthora palmivora TaxID=4796 RepID=A0A2P4X632_9STRA|nr:hypothetical protein PHPALM_30066 [Phytophthora palmivora]
MWSATELLLASSEPVSASRNSKLAAPGSPVRILKINTPANRYLRAYTTNEGDGEERGISVKLPNLDQLPNTFKSSKTKELQGLLKGDETIGDAFKKLKLSTMPLVTRKLNLSKGKITNFKLWSNHVAKVNKENPEAAMLRALTNVFGEKEVATMILLSKYSWRTSSVAKKMEKAQFNKWFEKGLDPHTVFVDVFRVKWNKKHLHPREKFIWGDYSTYYTKRIVEY